MVALTLGSLFDGIGVFPLAGSCYGITPTWASEIEKHLYLLQNAISLTCSISETFQK